MSWIRMHPYATAMLATAILFVVGIFIVIERSAVRPGQAGSSAWGGGAVPLIDPAAYENRPQTPPPQREQTIGERVLQNPPYTYTPPKPITEQIDETTIVQGQDFSSDFQSFLAMIEKSAGTKSTVSGGTDAYTFIPSGYISTSTASVARSDSQQKLYDFGNEAGDYIQSFEGQNSSMIQILKNQMEDRTDPEKAAAVVAIGRGLYNLGERLSNIEVIPQAVENPNEDLADSYREMGTKLQNVPAARTDQELIAAITDYNDAADRFAGRFIKLVNLFASYGVKFSADDPGSVFVFNSNNLGGSF